MTLKWWKNAEPLYRRFTPECFNGKCAKEAEEMFVAETYGGPQPSPAANRYAAGKRNLDATISMWKEDSASGILFRFELLEDKTFFGIKEWLNKVVQRLPLGTHALRRMV